MKLNHNFIRLPLKFSVEHLKQELSYFDDKPWMPHPNNLKGNSAIPLISQNGGDNDDFHGAMKITQHLKKCKYIQQILSDFGEVFGRSRLMKLEGNCEVSAHTDTNYHWHNRVRIHIPIITNPDVIFHCGADSVHMQAGECWIFDAWQQHRVINASDKTRVHLVVDTSGSSSFWNMVNSSEIPNIQTGPEDSLISFQENKPINIMTERFNNTPVLSPGELDGLIDEVILDIRNNSSNLEIDIKNYTSTLFNFKKDWRSLFYLHGYQESGTGQYRKLLDHTAESIQSLSPTVFTASNQISVQDVIYFKIFSAALEPHVRADFLGLKHTKSLEGKPKKTDNKNNKAVSKNEPCPCGSGKKYKRCHGISA